MSAPLLTQPQDLISGTPFPLFSICVPVQSVGNVLSFFTADFTQRVDVFTVERWPSSALGHSCVIAEAFLQTSEGTDDVIRSTWLAALLTSSLHLWAAHAAVVNGVLGLNVGRN